MTAEEIKRVYSMRDIAERYGVNVKRDGMCCCPFHKEKHPSMKIYKDSYNCFACGANGDIFTFVQNIENCDFKTAFYLLGGKYQEDHKKAKMIQYHAEKARQKREKEEGKLKEEIRKNNMLIHAYRGLLYKSEVDSDDWWYYLDKYHMAILNDCNLQERRGKY